MKGAGGRVGPVLAVGLALLGFGLLWSVGGAEFLDRPDTTLMMGIPFLVAGVVVTLLAVMNRRWP